MKMGTGQFAPFQWTNENLLTCAAAHSTCWTARNRSQQNYLRVFDAQSAKKKCPDSPVSETNARLPAAKCDYASLGYALRIGTENGK